MFPLRRVRISHAGWPFAVLYLSLAASISAAYPASTLELNELARSPILATCIVETTSKDAASITKNGRVVPAHATLRMSWLSFSERFTLLGYLTLSQLGYQESKLELRMVMPRVDSSSSNCATAGVISLFPGTITAHSRSCRNSFVLMRHLSSEGGVVAPI
jgi:hypothetical protein